MLEMKKSENELRRHRLYPYHKSDGFGFWRNETPFFKSLAPEEAEELLLLQPDEEFIDWKNKKIPILKGCCHIIWGAKTSEHSNCVSVLVRGNESWSIYESCNYEDKDELLEDATSNNAYPLRHAAIKNIIDTAPRSSIYENPFSGFDNPDKEHAPLEWLVEDMFPASSLNAIVGVSDSLKSFFAIHLACCIATGTQFFGKDVIQGPVLFSAPEGGEGVPKRREAWMAENGWQDCYIPFFTRAASFSFSSEKDREFLRAKLRSNSDFTPRAVFFDTLGQSLGDFDENSAKDVNKVARYLNDLKSEFNCAFFWVDHAGYEARRSRGSSAKFGALDTECFIARKGEGIKVSNTKMKDSEQFADLYIEATQKHGSLILTKIDAPKTHSEILYAIIKECPDSNEKKIRKKFYETSKASTDQAKQKAFKRSLDELTGEGKVFKQKTENETELVLKTGDGHTHPPL